MENHDRPKVGLIPLVLELRELDLIISDAYIDYDALKKLGGDIVALEHNLVERFSENLDKLNAAGEWAHRSQYFRYRPIRKLILRMIVGHCSVRLRNLRKDLTTLKRSMGVPNSQ